MNWWGEPWPHPDWRAPVCEDDALRIPAPLGAPCMQCGELITETDSGVTFPGFINATGQPQLTPLHAHQECNLRSVMGCSAHLRGEGHDHDVPYREDARRVQRWLDKRGTYG